MKNFLIHFSLLLVLFSLTNSSELPKRHSLDATIVVQNPRTETVYSQCPVPRQSFERSQYNDSLSAGRQSTQASLKLDGDKLIYDFLSENNTGVKDQVTKSIGSLILYVIFMIIGLALMLVLAPILICCCCQPDICPPCQACKNPEDHQYSTCEQKWPPILTILLAVVMLGTMIAVLVVQPQLEKGYSQTRCSAAILFDDLINGNNSNDGKDHFIGLKPLQVKLNSIHDQLLQGLQNSVSNKNTNNLLNMILKHLKQIKQQASDLPRGDGSSKKMDLSYISPINSAPQSTSPKTSTITSSLNSELGSKESGSSLVGSAYSSLTKTQHMLSNLFDFSSLLKLALPKLQEALESGLQKYDQMINKVENMDRKTNTQFQKYQNQYIHPFSIFVYVIASVAIAASVVLIIATLLVCIKQKMGCTKVVYGSCAILTVIGVLVFILSVVLSLGTGGTHYGCQYVERGLSTNADFKYRFQPIFNHELLTEMMAQCTTDQGHGIVIDQNLISQILASAKSANKHLAALTTHGEQHLAIRHQLLDTLRSYKHAQTLDIDSPVDIKILKKLSDPSLYSCTAPGFASDSWVPSVNQRNMLIPCKVGKQQLVTKETCPTLQQFETRTGACTGCIDTSSIFSQFSTYADVLQSLNKRYSSPDCKTFNEELANVWSNFYHKKSQTLAPIEDRAKAISTKIDQFNKLVKQSIKPNFRSHLLQLESHVQAISDMSEPKKINCHVLGEDVHLITNTFCRNFFNYAYSMRILSIIAGFASLGLMIFATFFAVRAWKIHSAGQGQEAKSQSSKGDGVPANNAQNS